MPSGKKSLSGDVDIVGAFFHLGRASICLAWTGDVVESARFAAYLKGFETARN